MFNIINSYKNQKDTIWNNINYLQYFYHLFPEHVDKFYWLFEKYVNPKIEQLKKSICKIPCTSDTTSMLRIINGILCIEKEIITELSKQLTSHITCTINGLDSLLSTIYCGQMIRFEHVKKKVDQEVKSFETQLEQAVKNISKEITLKKLEVIVSLDSHRVYVREELKKYVEKIGSDLSYIRYGIQGVHNDLALFEYRLGQIELIFQGGGYGRAVRNLWNKFVGARGEKSSDSIVFTDFLRKFKDFQRKKSTTTTKISSIREKIQTIRPKIKGIRSSLGALQIKIPNIGENDYKEDWNLMKKIESLKELNGDVPMATAVHREILGLISDFEKIDVIIKPLRDSIEPINDPVNNPLLSYIKEVTDAQRFLERAAKKIDDLLFEIRKTKLRLRNAIRINGYLSVIDPKLFSFEEPGSVSLDRIKSFMSTMSKKVSALENMDRSIKAYFENITKNYVSQFGPDGFLDEFRCFDNYISKKTEELKKELNKYIGTLEFIKLIHEQLKDIKQTSEEQETAMNGARPNVGLDMDKLKKIKEEIERFAEIRSNIGKIEECFNEKRDELEHIEPNITKLKLLKADLWKLRFSIRSDIMFANIIETIRNGFESLKTEAEKEFGKVECYIGYLITNIKSIIETLGSICSIVESIRCRQYGLNLKNLKNTINDLRIYLERLSHCINVLNEVLVGLKGIIRNLKKYVDKIIRLKTRIMVLSFEVMVLPFIERLPDLLFMSLGLDYMIKCHTFFDKIHESIKIAMDTIDKCKLFLRFAIFQNRVAEMVVDCLLKQIKKRSETITEDIKKVESSIESVIICFLKCSNKYITENTINLTKSMLANVGQVYNNDLARTRIHSQYTTKQEKYDNVWKLLSHMAVVESKFVLSRLYEHYLTRKKILMTLQYSNNCRCFCAYKSKHNDDHPHLTMTSEFIHSTKHLKLHKSELHNEGNTLCLCLVIIYHLYPNLVRCFCYLRDMELEILSTISRKFDKFTYSHKTNPSITVLIIFFVRIVKELTYNAKIRYLPSLCFCRCPNDSYYKYFISTIIYISSLVENIFRVDFKDVVDMTQKVVPLLSDIDLINSHCTNIPSKGPQEGKDCSNQKSTSVTLRPGNYSWYGRPYIKVRREKHPTGHKLSTRWLSGPRGKLGKLIAYRLLLSVSCKPFDGDKFGIDAAFPFPDINKVKEEAKKCNKHPCCTPGCNIKDCSPGSKCIKYNKPVIIDTCLNMVYRKFELVMIQISDNGILCLVQEIEEISEAFKMTNRIVETTMEENKRMIISTRNNRMCDSTNIITNKGMTNVNEGYYSYNDSYRINASRAHGSLKYIIIKLVLILIIVLMTIFIFEMLVLILSKSSIICHIFMPSLYDMFSIEGKLSNIDK